MGLVVGEVRGPGLVVRLSVEERAAWHAAARAAGVPRTAAWVRQVVAEHLDGGPPPSAVAAAGSVPVAANRVEVVAALGRIGSNVNQIARRVHVEGAGSGWAQAVLSQQLEQVRAELAALRAQVAG